MVNKCEEALAPLGVSERTALGSSCSLMSLQLGLDGAVDLGLDGAVDLGLDGAVDLGKGTS